MSNFGIPYMGSKSKIAPEVIAFLPKGKRLVDLFGGGFAITECAMYSKKWDSFLYNELNPLVVDLVKKAIKGEFNYKTFKPSFITSEEFKKKKESDGYIKYIWSFSNSGKTYLFGKNIEKIKEQGHNYCIFGKPIEGLNIKVIEGTLYQRRMYLKKWCQAKMNKRVDIRLEQLQRLERLQQLQRLERLQQLQRLEITNKSYLDYEYQEGDVVYCDPPYENTTSYSKDGFNHKEFYDWVASRPFPVYFSSYKISDDRFKIVWARKKRLLMNGARTTSYNFECIYTQKEVIK